MCVLGFVGFVFEKWHLDLGFLKVRGWFLEVGVILIKSDQEKIKSAGKN